LVAFVRGPRRGLRPQNTDRPLASTLNFTPNQTVPNLATVKDLGSGMVVFNGSGGTVQVIGDESGVYIAAS
jgi:hypothetical protein